MRKKVMAVIVAVLAFSLIAASAATLGGITVDGVGADTELVASCDTDGVTASFTEVYISPAYQVETVTIGGVADLCIGEDMTVTLANADGSVAVEVGPTQVVATSTNDNSLTFAVSGITVEQLRRVAVAIG